MWQLQVELPARADGSRRPLRKGGFATQREAENTLETLRGLVALATPHDTDALTTIADAIEEAHRTKQPWPTPDEIRRHLQTGIPTSELPTVTEYLAQWLPSQRHLAKGTVRSYETHIRLYLTPHIGDIRIDRLRRSHVASIFEAIDERNDLLRIAHTGDGHRDPILTGARIIGPATMQRIRATLRAALNDAIPEGLITSNPATLLDLPSGKAPKPVVWTPERVRRWRDTGHVPSPVMVWTPELTGEFLDHAVHDDLYALYHLIAMRGLRRGEACGLPWTNVEPTAVTVDTQIVQLGWATEVTPPKSDASHRIIPLDTGTATVLKAHRAQQRQNKLACKDRWIDSGLVFTHHDGSPLHPAEVTDQFKLLVTTANLPPIRLHDLRHGAATLALAAGADMKTVQELLGHASYALTANTYTSVLPEYARTAAENAANLVPRAANR